MKTSKYLASFAVIIFALSGLAVAQQLGEGYYGQQAAVPAVAPVRPLQSAQAQNPNPVLGEGYYGQQAPAPLFAGSQAAQSHSDTAAATPLKMVRCCEVKKVEKNISVPAAQEGDPSAPQNHVEYGGGGM